MMTIGELRNAVGREPTKSEKVALLIRSCRDDPVRFNDEVLGRRYYDPVLRKDRPARYWSGQRKVCEAVVRHKTVVVPTGHSIGKSFLAAGIILWWLYTRPHSLVIVTAPSQNLLGSVVFKEVRRALTNPLIPLAGQVTDSPKVSPQTLAVNNTGWQVIGIATRGMERISGQHTGELLVVVDEASGIDEDIWEALDSLNAQKTVVFGNPIRAEGRFRDLDLRATREKDDPTIPDEDRVVSIRIPSTDSPDIDKPRSSRGLADKGFLDNNRRQYGEGSLWWRSRILALFPDISVDALIPPGWIDACISRRRKPGEFLGHPRMGVDLSEGVGKDRSVIVVRDDLGVLDVYCDNLAGPEDVAGHIVRKRFQWNVAEHRICYDVGGVYGKDLARYLEAKGIFGATPYSGSFHGGPDFVNLRSCAGWRLRMRLDPGTTLDPAPDPKTGRVDPKITREKQTQFLIPPESWYPSMREEIGLLRYELYGHRTKLEPKEDLMQRLGRSPDLGDALLMTFAYLD